MKKILLAFFLFFTVFQGFSQKKYKISCIAFYNLENLFDTIDEPGVRDEEFTPQGAKHWNTQKYYHKLKHLAEVISQLGTELVPVGPVVMGVAEVENRSVLEDLVKQPAIADRHYQIIHYDSPDERGIDVALLYNPRFFRPEYTEKIPVHLPINDKTRDILYVKGKLDGDEIHFFVTHWPSRWGGKERSEPLRIFVAKIIRAHVDSILKIDPNAKIIIMGDLNDDPTDPSVKQVMRTVDKPRKIKPDLLFNPMEKKYKKGIGTLAYNDVWDLFDQFMLSYGLLGKDKSSYKYYDARIFNKKFLLQKSGRFKGYPYRSFVGNTFIGGYSDHLPVYLFLIKNVK